MLSGALLCSIYFHDLKYNCSCVSLVLIHPCLHFHIKLLIYDISVLVDPLVCVNQLFSFSLSRKGCCRHVCVSLIPIHAFTVHIFVFLLNRNACMSVTSSHFELIIYRFRRPSLLLFLFPLVVCLCNSYLHSCIHRWYACLSTSFLLLRFAFLALHLNFCSLSLTLSWCFLSQALSTSFHHDSNDVLHLFFDSS